MPKANAQRSLGLFSEPSYLSAGDPYDPPKQTHGRHKGLNIVAHTGKRGQLPSAFFDKQYKRLSEGDVYNGSGGAERKARKEGWNKCLTSNGFCYSSPSKRRTGLGDHHGNFSKIPAWEPKGATQKKTLHDIPPPPKANIMTSPVKKGSYGFPGLTMSHGSEYKYVSDPYNRPRELEQEEKKKVAEMTAHFTGGKGFNTMSHAIDCFDKTVYTDPEHLRGGYHEQHGGRDLLLEGRPPMIPSHPSKTLTASTGCFSKFPKQVPPGPPKPVPRHEVIERQVWCPSAPAKSMPQSSIMFKQF